MRVLDAQKLGVSKRIEILYEAVATTGAGGPGGGDGGVGGVGGAGGVGSGVELHEINTDNPNQHGQQHFFMLENLSELGWSRCGSCSNVRTKPDARTISVGGDGSGASNPPGR
ncbi:MAG: hypothetical protein HC933_06705 [Pleurocapsa sp. SU_196_0]|nr:hypothetical protein [Pleurocapsa sp. SU_196_0]